MRKLWTWAWVLVLFNPCAKAVAQTAGIDEKTSNVLGFESDFPQEPWDIKRQTAHFIGQEPVLFLDDAFILGLHNIQRSLHPLVKESQPLDIPAPFEGVRNLIIKSIVPAPDGESFYAYVSAQYNGKVLFLLYQTNDGVQFQPVSLNLLSTEQIRSELEVKNEPVFNNLLIFDQEHGLTFPPYFCTFYRVTRENSPPYEAIVINKSPRPRMAKILQSEDGIRWEDSPINVRHEVTFESNAPAYDPFRDRHLLYLRLWDPPKKPVTGWRKVIFSELLQEQDTPRWSDEELILEADEADGPVADIYYMQVTGYAGQYIGIPAVYHRAACPDPALQGTIHGQLAFSRDGKTWERVCQGEPFLPLGAPGTWDSGLIGPSGNPIMLQNQLYYYYWGRVTKHDEPLLSDYRVDCGLARLRVDGFVSLDAGPEGGTVLTVPFWPKGKHLTINADARGGEIRVEVLQDYTYVELKEFEKGTAGKGLFRVENCLPFRGDALNHRVEWVNGENFVDSFPPDWNNPEPLEKSGGKRHFTKRAIALKFYLKNARLYSFWFADKDAPLEQGRLRP